CCATQADLGRALEALASPSSSSRPKRILVETSGAASPLGVLRVIGEREALALDGIVTVVDASRLDVLREHDLALEQIGYADIVVLSRSDACDTVERARAIDRIVSHN